jgi:hypothetical protein
MRLKGILPVLLFSLALLLTMGCNQGGETPNTSTEAGEKSADTNGAGTLDPKLDQMYTEFTLTADLSHLSENQRKMIPILIEISKIMDKLFWQEAYGDKDSFLSGIKDPATRKFAEINYGPWDRLNNNKPFIAGVGEKPLGAQFYPADIKKEEIDGSEDKTLSSLYTMVRRKDDGTLYSTPYHQHFKEDIELAANKLKEAASLADDPGFKIYLELRAQALLTDEYYESDLAWMDMKNNDIDFVVGPIEVYEDKLLNAKAAHEGYVLIKDKSWSERLSKFAKLLPQLQKGLPVADKYKKETPGSDSDLNAYDVIYYAGDCNAGSKTIAINLPNDEKVQLKKGTRRLQLKNAMQAKYDKILVPISDVLIAADQRQHITFDAFFSNTMFHEVAHGLGIKNTINGKGTVRKALKERGSALEEGKADILGLYMISELLKDGHIEGKIEDYYVTFIAGIFRSIRFGAASAHGQANMLRFNFFLDQGAFVRSEDGTYRVEFANMEKAIAAMTEKILTIQGEGDYEGLGIWMEEKGKVGSQLQADLDRLAENNIPTDIVFKQGVDVLGL